MNHYTRLSPAILVIVGIIAMAAAPPLAMVILGWSIVSARRSRSWSRSAREERVWKERADAARAWKAC